MTCVANCWIVSGDQKGLLSMASISKKGEVKSMLELRLTYGLKDTDGREFAEIYALQKVYVKGMKGIMMAIELGGCCHLISVDYGRLSILQSIESIVPLDVVKIEFNRVVCSVTATAKRGQFIFGENKWTRLITVKYKKSCTS